MKANINSYGEMNLKDDHLIQIIQSNNEKKKSCYIILADFKKGRDSKTLSKDNLSVYID